jgi:hypothetical protein
MPVLTLSASSIPNNMQCYEEEGAVPFGFLWEPLNSEQLDLSTALCREPARCEKCGSVISRFSAMHSSEGAADTVYLCPFCGSDVSTFFFEAEPVVETVSDSCLFWETGPVDQLASDATASKPVFIILWDSNMSKESALCAYQSFAAAAQWLPGDAAVALIVYGSALCLYDWSYADEAHGDVYPAWEDDESSSTVHIGPLPGLERRLQEGACYVQQWSLCGNAVLSVLHSLATAAAGVGSGVGVGEIGERPRHGLEGRGERCVGSALWTAALLLAGSGGRICLLMEGPPTRGIGACSSSSHLPDHYRNRQNQRERQRAQSFYGSLTTQCIEQDIVVDVIAMGSALSYSLPMLVACARQSGGECRVVSGRVSLDWSADTPRQQLEWYWRHWMGRRHGRALTLSLYCSSPLEIVDYVGVGQVRTDPADWEQRVLGSGRKLVPAAQRLHVLAGAALSNTVGSGLFVVADNIYDRAIHLQALTAWRAEDGRRLFHVETKMIPVVPVAAWHLSHVHVPLVAMLLLRRGAADRCESEAVRMREETTTTSSSSLGEARGAGRSSELLVAEDKKIAKAFMQLALQVAAHLLHLPLGGDLSHSGDQKEEEQGKDRGELAPIQEDAWLWMYGYHRASCLGAQVQAPDDVVSLCALVLSLNFRQCTRYLRPTLWRWHLKTGAIQPVECMTMALTADSVFLFDGVDAIYYWVGYDVSCETEYVFRVAAEEYMGKNYEETAKGSVFGPPVPLRVHRVKDSSSGERWLLCRLNPSHKDPRRLQLAMLPHLQNYDVEDIDELESRFPHTADLSAYQFLQLVRKEKTSQAMV